VIHTIAKNTGILLIAGILIGVITCLGILLVAGYTGQPGSIPPAGLAATAPIENISPVSSPHQDADWIHIDPNLRFLEDEEITLTGTTSLPPDEAIWIHITPPGTGYREDMNTSIPGIRAVRGPGNTIWSATADTLLLTSLPTHPYSVTAHAENHPDIHAISNNSVIVKTGSVLGAKVPGHRIITVILDEKTRR
jgi:hypothetical protein